MTSLYGDQLANGNGNGNGHSRIPEEAFAKLCRPKLRSKTDGQAEYMETIDESIITLCDGPAGTGKSHIAVGKAAEMLINGKVKKIIFTRPAIECGPKQGHLPGNEKEKMAPYMRPIMYLLNKFFLPVELRKYLENETIELVSLAHMRGMTYDNTCMVMDEAQNASYEEIKMFLTRIGEDSCVIVSGDSTQRDISGDKGKAYERILDELDTEPYIDGLNIVELDESDIVRNGIITKILAKLGE